MDQAAHALLDNYVASAAFSAVLFGALCFAWLKYRQRYLGFWAAYWAVYAVVWSNEAVAMAFGPDRPAWLAGPLDVLSSIGGFAARLALALGILSFAGVAVGRRLARGAAAALLVFAAGAALARAVPLPPALGALFSGFTPGLLLFTALAAFLAWRSRGHAHPGPRWVLALGIAALALSDGLDVAIFVRQAVSGEAAALQLSERLSALFNHVCDALLAVGMWTGAIGEEWQRAEAAQEEARRSEARLQRAQRLESIGRLAGGIAHDFNNLLTAVLANLSMVQDTLPPDHAAGDEVRDAILASERAAKLTRQLLTFASRQVVKPRQVDLNESVTSMERMLSRLIGEQIALRTELAPGLWPVRIDPSQLEQLVVNLVVNGRDAIAGPGRIAVETSNHPRGSASVPGVDGRPVDGDWVCLVVADSGAGMDEATQARIFEPFFSTKDPGHGTGLGLATVHGIVQQAGGQVRVTSAPGAGSRFAVWLPRDLAPAEPLPLPVGPARAGEGRETILVAEDDAQVRLVATRVLTRRGYRVLEAANGRAALDAAAAHAGPIDLLVTDVVMPELGGKCLAQELATRRPGLRVLFVSGYAQGGIDPAVAFLAKPYKPDALALRVRELLDGRQERSSAA